VHAAIAVIERRGRILICRRRRQDTFGGHWEFPGGKRRPGESWPACLRRELREELGVGVRALRPYMRLRHHLGDRRVHFFVFRCALARGRPRPLAAAALRWVPRRRLRRFRFPPANEPLIERLAGRCPTENRVL
jgi:mutator protein MutT